MRYTSKCEKLSAYIDGELSSRAMRKIEEHLEHCPACRAKLRQLTNVSSMLEMLDPPSSPPARFFEHVTHQCLSSPAEGPVEGIFWQRWAWMGMPVAALLTVGVAVGLWGWRQNQKSASDDGVAKKVSQMSLAHEENKAFSSASSGLKRVALEVEGFSEGEDPWETEHSWNAAEEILLMQASIDLSHADSQFLNNPDAWGAMGGHGIPASWTSPSPVGTPVRKER